MSHLYLLGVATLTLTSASFAGSDTNADLQARLEAAEARISELSAATNANWLNDTRANEIRGLVHDVLADADTRVSLQGSGATAGYNGGFTVGSADGNWSLKINGLLQERWMDNTASPAAGASRDSRGFENTRTVLNFSGSIAGDWGYNMRFDAGAQNNDLTTVWAYGTMDLEDGWGLAMGNMKLPTNREWMINAEFQQGVERSYASQGSYAADGLGAGGAVAAQAVGAFANTTGLSVNYVGDDIRFWAMYGNGLETTPAAGNIGLYTANDNSNVWALRGEFMVSGAGWSQFDQFTSADGAAEGILIGVSYMHNDWGDAPVPVAGANSNTLLTLDGQMQFGGSNLYLAYQDNDVDGAAATSPSSFEVSYGIYLDSDWELYARYQDIDWDTTGVDNSDAFTVGINYYMAGQNAKWSTDVTWADSGWSADNDTGMTNSAPTDDQTMVRTQLQFYF